MPAEIVERIKDVACIVSSKFHEVCADRCERCPAFWENVDYWGEYDAGCTLHRDHLEFCPLSLLPKVVMRPYVKYRARKDEEHWERIYEEQRKKWDVDGGEQDAHN